MKNTHTALHEYVMKRPAVDAHEHLMPESVRLALKPDVIWLFHQYAISDLISAGMPAAEAGAITGKDPTTMPLERKWQIFKPFFETIRFTGYTRAVLYAIKDLYGFDTLDDNTYQAISAKIEAENTPGITDRFLGKQGHIVSILNCNYLVEQPAPYSYPIMAFPHLPAQKTGEYLHALESQTGVSITSLDSLLAGFIKLLDRYRTQGVIGLKITAAPRLTVAPAQANSAFTRFMAGDRTTMPEEDNASVNDFVFDQILQRIPGYRYTIAVHCGYLSGCNADFSRTHIRHMLPILQRYPEVHFDLFHLSYPWMDEAVAIGKQFVNVSLNLAWCHILDPSATVRAMIDLINAVPINKVLAMGGDYWRLPDVAYGHLKLARELLSRALATCREECWITEADGRLIADRWLFYNAYDIYPLLPKGNAISGNIH